MFGLAVRMPTSHNRMYKFNPSLQYWIPRNSDPGGCGDGSGREVTATHMGGIYWVSPASVLVEGCWKTLRLSQQMGKSPAPSASFSNNTFINNSKEILVLSDHSLFCFLLCSCFVITLVLSTLLRAKWRKGILLRYRLNVLSIIDKMFHNVILVGFKFLCLVILNLSKISRMNKSH